MAIFSVNIPNAKVTIHKNSCPQVHKALGNINLTSYTNGYTTSPSNNQIWFSEQNFSLDNLRQLLNKDYCKNLCSYCF